MIAIRWTKKWHQTPRFTTLLLPVAWSAAGGTVSAIVGAGQIASNGRFSTSFFILAAIVPAIWVVLMVHANHQLGDGQGARLALLAHVLFAGYIACVVGSFWFLLRLATGTLSNVQTLLLLMTVPAIGLTLFACRTGEKYIARQCIRAYFIRNASGKRES